MNAALETLKKTHSSPNFWNYAPSNSIWVRYHPYQAGCPKPRVSDTPVREQSITIVKHSRRYALNREVFVESSSSGTPHPRCVGTPRSYHAINVANMALGHPYGKVRPIWPFRGDPIIRKNNRRSPRSHCFENSE
jgi:hypothetical protein